MWVRHCLLFIVITGGILAFSGFTITMFGYAASCESEKKCQASEYSNVLLYKVSGPIFFILGLIISTTGVVLKWLRKPKHLRLDQRVSSIEGTNFTGETNIEGGEESFEPLPGESQNFPIENEEIINSLRDLPDLHEGNAQNLPSENDGIDRGILTAQESSIIQDISGVESTITDSSTDTSSYVSPSWLVKSPLISSSGAIEEDRHLPVELSDEDGEGIDETDKFIIDHNDKRDSGKEEDC